MSAPTPEEGKPVLSVWVGGDVWHYGQGGTRIRSFAGEEINVWDHAAGAPGIEFTAEAIEARVTEWLADNEEADRDARARRPGTPEGMTDEEWSTERFGYRGEHA